MDICILSQEEVGQLKHYKKLPCCSNHRHIKLRAAIRQIELEKMELFEHDGHQYLTVVKLHFLAVTGSGIPTVQRVLRNPPKHIQPYKFARLD